MQRLNVSSCKKELKLACGSPNFYAKSYAKCRMIKEMYACDMLFRASITAAVLDKFFTTANFRRKLMK